MFFTSKKIGESEESIGLRLRREREVKNLTLEEAARKTGIKSEYLAALEGDNYHLLPGGVYEKTFLKKYSSFLKLKLSVAEKKPTAEKGTSNEKSKNVFSKKKIRMLEFLVFPKILRNVLIVIFFAALLLYLGLYFQNSFSPPQMEIYAPTDNLITENSFAEIIGRTNAPTQIAINGEQILKDETGVFRKKVDLSKGINTIVISAKNKYGREKIVTKQILVK